MAKMSREDNEKHATNLQVQRSGWVSPSSVSGTFNVLSPSFRTADFAEDKREEKAFFHIRDLKQSLNLEL